VTGTRDLLRVLGRLLKTADQAEQEERVGRLKPKYQQAARLLVASRSCQVDSEFLERRAAILMAEAEDR